MENGILARCIVLEAGERGTAGEPHEEDFPETVIDTVRNLIRIGHENNLTGEFPRPLVLQENPDATNRIREILGYADEEYRKASERGDDSANALWARAGEKVLKLAAIYAISENAVEPVITIDGVNWAWRFIEHMTRRMLFMASMFVADTDFDAQAMKVIRLVRQKRGRISHGKLLRNSHLDKDAFKRVVETLIESGTLRKEFGDRGGVFYVLAE